MGEVDRHEPGFFCWADLSTTDLDGATTFYRTLFDWDTEDQAMGEGDPYRTFKVNGRSVAAVYTQRPEQEAAGTPPNWSTYVSVESADEIAKRARDAGGNVLMDADDVFDQGRMCVIQDPAGAVLGAWEPRKHIGAELIGDPVSVSWNELMTTDVAAAAAFYGKVFEWTIEEQDMPNGTYTLFKKGDRFVGGMMGRVPESQPPFWSVYIEVVDCDDTAARTKDLGGEVMMPPQNVPTVGTFALLQDPQKAAFYVITSEPPPT